MRASNLRRISRNLGGAEALRREVANIISTLEKSAAHGGNIEPHATDLAAFFTDAAAKVTALKPPAPAST